MNKNRPVYLGADAFMGLPITAVTSISHRISGVIMFAALPLLLWMLAKSLESENSFEELKVLMSGALAKLVLWGIVSAFIFHVVAGFRHLLMDLGIGESLEGGRRGAILVLVLSALLIVAAGVWICLPI
jgi:succinate dehydrogenase / fumarate reductase, cytochrome b subunit